MRMSFGKELIFGIVSMLLLSILVLYFAARYNKQAAINSNPSLKKTLNNVGTLNVEEISKHNNAGDCWLIIENKVYVVSDFLPRHPGGSQLITPYCGQDATQPFFTKGGRGISHSATAMNLLGLTFIGDLNGTVLKQPDTNAIKMIKIDEEEGEENDE